MFAMLDFITKLSTDDSDFYHISSEVIHSLFQQAFYWKPTTRQVQRKVSSYNITLRDLILTNYSHLKRALYAPDAAL